MLLDLYEYFDQAPQFAPGIEPPKKKRRAAPITVEIEIVLPAADAYGTGRVIRRGSARAAVDGISASASGTVRVDGSSRLAAPASTSSGSAKQAHRAAAAARMPSADLVAASRPRMRGAVAVRTGVADSSSVAKSRSSSSTTATVPVLRTSARGKFQATMPRLTRGPLPITRKRRDVREDEAVIAAVLALIESGEIDA